MLLIRLMVRDLAAPKGHPMMWLYMGLRTPVRRPADLVLPHSISWWSAHGAIYRHACVSALSHAGPERDEQIIGGFIKGILRGVRCTNSLRVLFLHRRPPSWTTLVLYARAVFIFNEPAYNFKFPDKAMIT